jgi:hypothetical protein
MAKALGEKYPLVYLEGTLEHLQQVVLSMQPCENIFHIQVLVMYSFATPPIKLKLGQQANTWGTTNSKTAWTNHYDEPIRNTEQQLDHIYYTLFCMCTPLQQRLVPAHGNLPNYVEPKLFS